MHSGLTSIPQLAQVGNFSHKALSVAVPGGRGFDFKAYSTTDNTHQPAFMPWQDADEGELFHLPIMVKQPSADM
jgi:hypothetical protein